MSTHWQCAYQTVPTTGPRLNQLAQRQEIWKTLMPIQGTGQISFEQGTSAVTLLFQFQFLNADTLLIQLRDPLGRQLAHIAFMGSDYEIHLLRENRILAGTDWPTWVQKYVPLSLTPADLRWLLLGAPYIQTPSSASVRYRLNNYKWGVKQMLIPGQATLTYRRFQVCGAMALAKEILIELPSRQGEMLIQLTDFQWTQSKLSPNKVSQ